MELSRFANTTALNYAVSTRLLLVELCRFSDLVQPCNGENLYTFPDSISRDLELLVRAYQKQYC